MTKTELSIVVVILLFCCTELTLSIYLPLARTDRDVWLKYFLLKDAIYDVMFLLFFCIIFALSNTTNLKALSAFGTIVSGGSVVDKVIFDINQFLASDIILILVALTCSIAIKLKWKTSKLGR